MMVKQVERYTLIVLDVFLAVTAMAGGIGLLTGVLDPGIELLQGSPFSTYTIPGLALLAIVGGSALLAAGLLLRLPQLGVLASAVAGMMIMGFELVEVLVVSSDPGVARNLQLFYFALGLLIAGLATTLWMTKHELTKVGG